MIYTLNHGVKPSWPQQLTQYIKTIADKLEYKHAVATIVGLVVAFWLLLLIIAIRMGQNPLTFPSQFGGLLHKTASTTPADSTAASTSNDDSTSSATHGSAAQSTPIQNGSSTPNASSSAGPAAPNSLASAPLGGMGGDPAAIPAPQAPAVIIPPTTSPIVTPTDPGSCICSVAGDLTSGVNGIVNVVPSTVQTLF